eukprot:782678-Rhodomonas_salina.2
MVEVGATTRKGPQMLFSSASHDNKEIVCTVFPSPISSARIPFRPCARAPLVSVVPMPHEIRVRDNKVSRTPVYVVRAAMRYQRNNAATRHQGRRPRLSEQYRAKSSREAHTHKGKREARPARRARRAS